MNDDDDELEEDRIETNFDERPYLVGVSSSSYVKESIQNSKKSKTFNSNDDRVIAHIDLDCFYVQVERYHNPDLKEKPVAVVQYNPFGDLKSYAPSDNRFKDNGSIIAVSYEARAKGVTRIMRGGEARKICPEILLVQVPTSHGKADLHIYREASAKILKVLGQRYPAITIERASIDEVYLDVTKEATRLFHHHQTTHTFHSFFQESVVKVQAVPSLIAGENKLEMALTKTDIRNGYAGQGSETNPNLNPNETKVVISFSDEWFARPLPLWSVEDQLLLCGAVIINELRQDVFTVLGFTTSAGIAYNKMLAKLASGMHKPNKQTLVPRGIVSQLMQSLPYSRVQGFGGKLGHDLQRLLGEEITTMGQLLSTPKEVLIQHFGEETTQWMLQKAQGMDLDPVQDRALPISIGCSKSFRSTNMLLPTHFADQTVMKWIIELSEEVLDRMKEDTTNNGRKAKLLHVGGSIVLHVSASKNKRNGNSNSNSNGVNKKPVSASSTSSLSSTVVSSSSLNLEEKKDNTTLETSNNNTTMDQRVAEWWQEQGLGFSKQIRLPSNLSYEDANTFAKLAYSLIVKAIQENPRLQTQQQPNSKEDWGITSLGISVTQFEAICQGKQSIKAFLQPKGTTQQVSSAAAMLPVAKDEKQENGQQGDDKDTATESLGGEVLVCLEVVEAKVEVEASRTKRSNMEEEINNEVDDGVVVILDDADDEDVQHQTNQSESEAIIIKPTVLKDAQYEKYLKDVIDYETYLSLPYNIQQEIVHEHMFSQSFSASKRSRTSKSKSSIANWVMNKK